MYYHLVVFISGPLWMTLRVKIISQRELEKTRLIPAPALVLAAYKQGQSLHCCTSSPATRISIANDAPSPAPRRLVLACFVTNAPVTISVLTEVIGLLVHGFFFPLSLCFFFCNSSMLLCCSTFLYLVRRVQNVPIFMY